MSKTPRIIVAFMPKSWKTVVRTYGPFEPVSKNKNRHEIKVDTCVLRTE